MIYSYNKNQLDALTSQVYFGIELILFQNKFEKLVQLVAFYYKNHLFLPCTQDVQVLNEKVCVSVRCPPTRLICDMYRQHILTKYTKMCTSGYT